MKIFAITNQKGGVGKSTTAQALAAGLARRGLKTLLIDLDAQGNTSYSFGAAGTSPCAYELLTYKATLKDCIHPTDLQNLHIIAGGHNLIKIETELVETGKEYRLREIIGRAKFDAIVIDTAPAISTATANALTAANVAVVPCQPTIYTIEAVKHLFANIDAIKRYTNPKLTLGGLLLTRHSSRANIAKSAVKALEAFAEKSGTKVFSSIIPESAAIQEAQTKKMDIFAYAPKNKAAKAYDAFIDELMKA